MHKSHVTSLTALEPLVRLHHERIQIRAPQQHNVTNITCGLRNGVRAQLDSVASHELTSEPLRSLSARASSPHTHITFGMGFSVLCGRRRYLNQRTSIVIGFRRSSLGYTAKRTQRAFRRRDAHTHACEAIPIGKTHAVSAVFASGGYDERSGFRACLGFVI